MDVKTALSVIETARLIGSRPCDADYQDFCRLWRDRRVVATLTSDGQVPPATELERRWTRWHEHWDRYGFGTWIFRDRRDGQFSGYAGLHRAVVLGTKETEVLYALPAQIWGQGFATEMAKALIHEGCTVLQFATIIGYTLEVNTASQRVLEKAGMRHQRNFVHAGLPHRLYRYSVH